MLLGFDLHIFSPDRSLFRLIQSNSVFFALEFTSMLLIDMSVYVFIDNQCEVHKALVFQ